MPPDLDPVSGAGIIPVGMQSITRQSSVDLGGAYRNMAQSTVQCGIPASNSRASIVGFGTPGYTALDRIVVTVFA